jgi:coenzyme PQQ synthesis protein D (PqqD)
MARYASRTAPAMTQRPRYVGHSPLSAARSRKDTWVRLARVAELSIASALTPSRDVVFRELDGEGVILNLASGVYFGLDETGTRMWHLIEQHHSLDAVLAALLEEYDAARETIEQDLIRLASELSEKGLLVVESSDTP